MSPPNLLLPSGDWEFTQNILHTLEEPKTESGKRAMALPSSIAAYLKHRIGQSKERLLAGELWEENDLEVCTALVRPGTQSNVCMLF